MINQAMSLFKQYTRYQSEMTQFLKDLKEKNPKIEEEQRQGRARLWDQPELDLDTLERDKASRVEQQAYVYQNKPK
jgi:hypothetical protein